MTADITLLINSCDAYSDILDTFFELLHRFWPDLKYEIVLSTETLNYTNKYFQIRNIHPNNVKCSWTRRIYETLENIQTDYVLLLLDDLFIYDFVKNDKILKCLKYLKKDKNIVNFTFWPRLKGWKKTNIY